MFLHLFSALWLKTSRVSEVSRRFLGPVQRQVCAFPNPVQSAWLTTALLLSKCGKIRSLMRRKRLNLSSRVSRQTCGWRCSYIRAGRELPRPSAFLICCPLREPMSLLEWGSSLGCAEVWKMCRTEWKTGQWGAPGTSTCCWIGTKE